MGMSRIGRSKLLLEVIAIRKKIAKYIGKYITKDLISEFNKKRYWQSAGISIEEAQVYWLSALSMPEALREGLQMFGLWSEELEGRCRGFSTRDRVAWVAVDPKSLSHLFRLCPVSRRVALVVEHLAALTSKPVGEVSWLLVSLIVLLDTRVYLLLTKTLRCSSEPLSVLVFLRFMKNKCPQLSRGPY